MRFYIIPLLALAATMIGAPQAHAAMALKPAVFWASDPVLPGDTVLAMGEDMQGATSVTVGRLADGPAGTSALNGEPSVVRWLALKPLQVTGQSVKFAIPSDWKRGVYAFRVRGADAGESRTVLVNAPDPWWMQADRGDTGSPGGWLRVFGKSLRCGPLSLALLTDASGRATVLKSLPGDDYGLRFELPPALRPGKYAVSVHNGCGGSHAWASVATLNVAAPAPWPARVFDVMAFYGADREKEIAKTLDKGSPALDRTEALAAALKGARENGGGVVFFPEGKYAIRGTIQVPPHTLLRGAGMGLVDLWWGKGGFALDGGSSERRLQDAADPTPPELISGTDFGLEEMSLYLPRDYTTAINAGDGFRMSHVRIRVDRYWIRGGQREDGLTLRLGNNCQITDCDILAKGVAAVMGRDEVFARNKVMAGKSNCSLEHSDGAILEDNDFISLDPTAYENLSGEGRNIYYARNGHKSFFAQQSDFSWTFDGTGQAYLGKLAQSAGTDLTLATDPTFPAWAKEDSPLWKRSVVCVLTGRGAGQYRYVTGGHGRAWVVDRPFDVAPDETSILSIVPFRGRVLVIGNHFEDSGWVNMGYGSSFDVICANNTLNRVGAMLNLGLRDVEGVQPSWYIQYLDNDIAEGQTLVQSTGDERNPNIYAGSVTRACIHRRQHIHADNSGSIDIGGNATDIVVEHCDVENSRSEFKADANTRGVLFRSNTARNAAPHYGGNGLANAMVIP